MGGSQTAKFVKLARSKVEYTSIKTIELTRFTINNHYHQWYVNDACMSLPNCTRAPPGLCIICSYQITSRSGTISLPAAGAWLDYWLTKVGVMGTLCCHPQAAGTYQSLATPKQQGHISPLLPPIWRDISVPCRPPWVIATPYHSQANYMIPYHTYPTNTRVWRRGTPPNYHSSDQSIPTSHQSIYFHPQIRRSLHRNY
jgi:hypothetical protein